MGKQPLPFGDQMEQLTGGAQSLLALRAAELLRRHGAQEAVAGRTGVVLLDLLTAHRQGGGLRSQPGQKTPDRGVVQAQVVVDIVVRRTWRRLIFGPLPSRFGRLAVGLPVVLDVAAGQMEKSRAGVAFIGEYESRDNRSRRDGSFGTANGPARWSCTGPCCSPGTAGHGGARHEGRSGLGVRSGRKLLGNAYARHLGDIRPGCVSRLRLQLSGGAVRY